MLDVLITLCLQGDQCWRLDGNMVMEPGYPKPLVSEFPGLTGHISAALAVPATRSKPETVYFFKNGEEQRQTQNNSTVMLVPNLTVYTHCKCHPPIPQNSWSPEMKPVTSLVMAGATVTVSLFYFIFLQIQPCT